ncbi:uncharacterized protein LOC106670048 isoform X2 [Cimex lectularius]|uniref:Uncharacterized protein n=1 Tax=Cimex lectularius TaxID=79782 RepID=A0A8I6S1Y9_CIMLE|nr:uncharacterized protein LOC106670048 isoform X2 [Cimex lectularius]
MLSTFTSASVQWTMPGDVIYTISGRGSNCRLVMEDNDRKQHESTEKAQIEVNVSKYPNGDTLQRERRYHARRNKALAVTSPTVLSPENTQSPDLELLSRRFVADHGDTFSTLPVQMKLKTFGERFTKNSCVQTSPVSSHKSENPCDQEDGEKFQEIQKVKAEVKQLSTMYVKLPPEDCCDTACQPSAITKEKSTIDMEPKDHELEKLNNNKEEKDEKEDYPCIVDCLYYSMQCCDCSII